MARVAIIPARGGSKRIPRKNIRDFLGKPIIAYSIESALKSGLFDEVMVSTEDEEIAEIAKKYGAKVPFVRSEKNSDDHSTTVDVLMEVLSDYSGQGITFEEACCIYPTAPLIKTGRIQESFELMGRNGFDSVFPVVPYSYPIQRSLKLDKDQKMEMFFDDYKSTRSQDLEESFHDAGQFYTFSTKMLMEKHELWTENTGTIVLEEMEVQDIDTIQDWQLAELKFKLLDEHRI